MELRDRRQAEELDTQIGKASAVMRVLHYLAVIKPELSKTTFSIFKTVFVPILTYGHKSWVMTGRVRSQRSESFYKKSQVLNYLTRCVALRYEHLLTSSRYFSELKYFSLDDFGYVSRMPQERLSKQALLAKANRKRPGGRPTTRWTNGIEQAVKRPINKNMNFVTNKNEKISIKLRYSSQN